MFTKCQRRLAGAWTKEPQIGAFDRVGTWNGQYGREVDKNRLWLKVLTERDADVWVLTETHDDLALSYPYQSIHTEQRYRTNNGGRWTSIWTRFPIIERINTIDPSRTVCARLQADTGLEVVAYGTVLPWMHDRTRDADDPRPAWSEFYRVTDQQAVEWKRLRGRYPSAALVVAGDLNHNLGGPHYYGTNKGRNQLHEALAGAELDCLTQTDNFPPGQLGYPPIDHVCAAPPRNHQLSASVEGWEKTTRDGVTLSDHSGVLADIEFRPRPPPNATPTSRPASSQTSTTPRPISSHEPE